MEMPFLHFRAVTTAVTGWNAGERRKWKVTAKKRFFVSKNQMKPENCARRRKRKEIIVKNVIAF